VLTGLDKGAKAHIDQLAADLGVTGFIDYKGFLSKSEIQSLYLKASITVMPSILGPTNLPPLESLLNGCPVAVTNAGSWGLTSFNGVLILDAFDISAWAKVLDSSYDLPIVEISAVASRLEDLRETNHKILKDFFCEFKTLQSLYK
jgi:glycosyltransferase involved in cell wall biosynthesis